MFCGGGLVGAFLVENCLFRFSFFFGKWGFFVCVRKKHVSGIVRFSNFGKK